MQVETIVGPAGPIEVRVVGEGPTVMMIPSLGRGARDFDDLSARVAAAGYRCLAPEPRGIGGSTGALDDLSMADLAADAAAVVRSLGGGRATVVGHAFGNRVARMLATDHAEVVESVVLLACGGIVQPEPEIHEALFAVFDVELSDDQHLAHVATAFFAPGNDPGVWFDGWHGGVAFFQGRATANQPVAHWWGAGSAPVLVVQPADDLLAPPANADRIKADLGARARLVTIDDAGHALLPEQPEAVAAALLEWLSETVQPA